MTRNAIVMALMFAALCGCTDNKNADELLAIVKHLHNDCKPVGQGVELGHYWGPRKVVFFLCPDGSIGMLPDHY